MAGVYQAINGIDGLRIVRWRREARVEFAERVPTESIEELLQVLTIYDYALEFFDPCFPSRGPTTSPPGAYFRYSPRRTGWRMTLGSFDWSGGVFRVEQLTIVCQLRHLHSTGLLDRVEIEPVRVHHDYGLEGPHADNLMNAQLLDIHGKGFLAWLQSPSRA